MWGRVRDRAGDVWRSEGEEGTFGGVRSVHHRHDKVHQDAMKWTRTRARVGARVCTATGTGTSTGTGAAATTVVLVVVAAVIHSQTPLLHHLHRLGSVLGLLASMSRPLA